MKKFLRNNNLKLVLGIILLNPFCAFAQSLDSFAAKPILNEAKPFDTMIKVIDAKPKEINSSVASPVVSNAIETNSGQSLIEKKQSNGTKLGQMPVIMFCAKPQDLSVKTEIKQPAMIANSDHLLLDAKDSGANNLDKNLPSNMVTQALNPNPNFNNSSYGNNPAYSKNIERPNQRGPFKAIYEDTKTAIKRDVPQALADSLPWVDANRKQEPFENVLERVSDNLARANVTDPEWALPAQSEIRELAVKLDRLSNPPQIASDFNYAAPYSNPNNTRAFRPRPVWPGAQTSLNETQIRPATLTTSGVDEFGGRALISHAENTIVSEEVAETMTTPAKPKKAKRK